MDTVDHDAFRIERALGCSKFEGYRLAAEPFVVLREHCDLEHPVYSSPLFEAVSSKLAAAATRYEAIADDWSYNALWSDRGGFYWFSQHEQGLLHLVRLDADTLQESTVLHMPDVGLRPSLSIHASQLHACNGQCVFDADGALISHFLDSRLAPGLQLLDAVDKWILLKYHIGEHSDEDPFKVVLLRHNGTSLELQGPSRVHFGLVRDDCIVIASPAGFRLVSSDHAGGETLPQREADRMLDCKQPRIDHQSIIVQAFDKMSGRLLRSTPEMTLLAYQRSDARLLISHGVDACSFPVSPSLPADAEVPPVVTLMGKHDRTYPAIAFVQKGKQDRKCTLFNRSAVMMIDGRQHWFAYERPPSSDRDLSQRGVVGRQTVGQLLPLHHDINHDAENVPLHTEVVGWTVADDEAFVVLTAGGQLHFFRHAGQQS